jgi:hypothetical protein
MQEVGLSGSHCMSADRWTECYRNVRLRNAPKSDVTSEMHWLRGTEMLHQSLVRETGAELSLVPGGQIAGEGHTHTHMPRWASRPATVLQ